MTDASGLIVHAGAPKCGSSALQTVLSHRPVFTGADGRRYAYCCLNEDGSLLSGRSLRIKAALSPFFFTCSRDIATTQQMARMLPAADNLRRFREDNGTPVLSSEGWVRRAKFFAESRLLERAGGGAHVVIFVRPPMEWLNSGWWQWGVWSGNPLDRFIKRNVALTRWAEQIEAWRAVPGVARVSVRLASQDVVPQFFDLLDAQADRSERSNSGVPAAFLYFELRNRRFRASPHASQTEFAVGRHLRDVRASAPWVLPQAKVAALFDELSHVPGELATLLEPAQRKAMEADPRWWSPAPYAGRQVADPDRYATPASLTGLYDALIAGLRPFDRLRHGGERARLVTAAPGGPEAADPLIAGVVDRILARDLRRRGRRLVWL